jgi:hypothetical protein
MKKLNLTNIGIIAGGLALAYYLYKSTSKKQAGYVQASQYIPAWGGADVSLGAKKTDGLTWI